VQEQVDAGLLTPEQARYHPYSNVITRCVGANDAVEADVLQGEFKVGDLFLIAPTGSPGWSRTAAATDPRDSTDSRAAWSTP
jgi:hypothetical protein